MSLAINAPPTNAECRCPLADGRLLTITASRRQRANRAEVKCVVDGAPGLAARMQEVVRIARLTEPLFDSREQVVLSMDMLPAPGERGWELAAVLADRMVRGAYQPPRQPVIAHGWSDHWQLGQVQGDASHAYASWDVAGLGFAGQTVASNGGASPAAASQVVGGQFVASEGGATQAVPSAAAAGPASRPLELALLIAGGTAGAPGVWSISHLGALRGHADPSAAVSSVRCWFPLHSGGVNDSLAWVEVSVYPLDEGAGAEEEQTIAAPGLDAAAQQEVRHALAGARHFDGRGLGRWRTVVRFGPQRFQGQSYQLALVMADRLARGREFVPRGRLIASGCSSAWHAGRVDTVEGGPAKLDLIMRQAAAGDRILLPRQWQDSLPAGYASALRARGASLACIDRIGML
jgi:hypothetical protein